MENQTVSPQAFPRFMVEEDLGSNPKISRLDNAQFRCLLTGVWALAAKADPRGYLVVAGSPATEHDVAHQARCTPAIARKTMVLLRSMGMIEMDDELGIEFCHDWWSINPDPTPDPTNAERQAKWRERRRAEREATRNGKSNGARNGKRNAEAVTVTATEVKGKEKEEANASSTDQNARVPAHLVRHTRIVYDRLTEYAAEHDLPAINRASLARIIRSRPLRPFVRCVEDYLAWQERQPPAKRHKDLLRGYEWQLDNRCTDLAAPERLADDDTPTRSTASNVVAISSRAAKDATSARRLESAKRVLEGAAS